MLRYYVIRVENMESALEALTEYGDKARLIAGGTDIMVQIREKTSQLKEKKCLVDISGLQVLHTIMEDNETVHIGATVTHTEIVRSSIVQKYAPLLTQACSLVGSPQIRNTGTLAGAIANASPASDIIPPLIALDSRITLRSKNSTRSVSLPDIFTGPYKTNIKPDEMIEKISFKKLDSGYRTFYFKLGRRRALAVARLDMAVVSKVNGQGIVEDIRIVPGAIFESFGHAKKAEEILMGNLADAETVNAAAKSVSKEMVECTGIRWSSEYKIPVVEEVARRILSQVLEA